MCFLLGGTNEILKKLWKSYVWTKKKLKIHGTGNIYLHEWLIFYGKLVGKYTSPMDPQGNVGAANRQKNVIIFCFSIDGGIIYNLPCWMSVEKSSNRCWYLTAPADNRQHLYGSTKSCQKWWKTTVPVTKRAQNRDNLKEVHLLMADILHQLIW